ncbi:MAG: imidazolonepropionase [Sulfolobales archaeon]
MYRKVDLLIHNASEIITLPRVVRGYAREEDIGVLYDGFIAVRNGLIEYVGEKKDISKFEAREVIDVEGGIVTPGLIDPHTHLAYYGSREDEFERLLLGESYLEILRSGGGILRTMRDTSNANTREIIDQTLKRIRSLIKSGVTAVEIKSGYGIEIDSEVKLLDAISMIRTLAEIDVVPTLLAHIPFPNFERREFIRIFVERLLHEAKKRKFEYVDVFCDQGAFDLDESRVILTAGRDQGFGLRIHADELVYMGCSDLGVELNVASIDHLNQTPVETLSKISKRDIVAILSPTTSLYIVGRKPDVATLLREKAIIAIATDHSPALMNLDMIETLNLAATYFMLSPANLIASVTVNASYSLGLRSQGSVKEGYLADLVLWDLKSYRFIGYERRRDIIKKVIKRGKVIYSY